MALLSPKQQQIWNEIHAENARWNVMAGAVASGKTYLGYILKAKRMLRVPQGNCLLVGKTYRSYCRNVLDPMREMWGPELVELPRGDGTVTLFGRKCYIVGANDERAVQKIQGISLVYCDGDEFATWPESFFEMLKSRLRMPGATCDLTCNPDGPHHWAKRFIDGGGVRYWHFRLTDNPFNAQEFVDAISREYSGLWYRRHILGEWVQAEGAVYDMFDVDSHTTTADPATGNCWVGIDYGTTNPTVALVMRESDGRMIITDELRMSGATDLQSAERLKGWIADLGISPQWIFIDPSAASFRLQLHQLGVTRVAPADNEVVNGIRRTASLLSAGKLLVSKSCDGLIGELTSYVWDAAAQSRGEDKPVKQNDHGPDALRYLVNGTRTVWERWLKVDRIAA